VQRGDKVASTGQATPTVAQASSAAPIQTAQAGAAAGGASGGASTGGVFAGVGTAGSVGSTVVFVGSAVRRGGGIDGRFHRHALTAAPRHNAKAPSGAFCFSGAGGAQVALRGGLEYSVACRVLTHRERPGPCSP